MDGHLLGTSPYMAHGAKNGDSRPRIVIVGGGYVGLNTALRLEARLRHSEASVVVIDQQPHMTYQPFLPEVAAASVEPRHVIAPLRSMLRRCEVLTGRVGAIDHHRRTVTVTDGDGATEEIGYDVLAVAPGSISRILPIPGLAEQGIGFKTVSEAIYLRNHVLSRLDAAASATDTARRRRLLTFLTVGGGYAGIEALAEMEDMSRLATRDYPAIDPAELRWVLVEATDRIMPEVSRPMGEYTVDLLRERGIEVHLETTVSSMEDGHVVLGDGTEFDTDTVIWTAGVRPDPMLGDTTLPLDQRGRVRCTATLQVAGVPGVFAAGDCAAVPDLTRIDEDPDATCGPSAQHAARQARRLGDNIVATIRGHRPAEYRHAYIGSVAGLGLYQGVAEIYGVRLKGLPAWLVHRAYHLAKMPSVNRKVRIAFDWLLAALFRREAVAIGSLQDPRSEFRRAADAAGRWQRSHV